MQLIQIDERRYRALVERCERLRRLVVAERRYRDANTGYPGTASGAEVSAAAREWVATRDALDPGDLDDDLHDLDHLPPLLLAPLPE